VIIQKTLIFEPGVVDLDRAQIVELVNWIADSTSRFPKYDDAYVEAGASDPAPRMAKQLAERRASNIERILRSLLPFKTSVETRADGYREKRVALDGGNDYVTVQLNPDFKFLGMPTCNPVPIPSDKVPAR
jgi:hypothetical protein